MFQGILMKTTMLFIVAFILPLAFAHQIHERTLGTCPDIEYPNCYDTTTMMREDEPGMRTLGEMIQCWGGYDSDWCPLPDFCMPMMSGLIGDDGNECYTACPQTCNENQASCDMGYYNGCWQGNYCSDSYGDCPATCYAMCNYDAGEEYCDMGYDDNQCWMGSYCAQPWGECPAICPTYCDWEAGETYCDHPYDSNGCWMGNYCAPAGEECPVQCPVFDPVECDWETEMVCWGGNDYNGCAMPDYCTPMMVEGADGAMCYGTCYQYCGENEMMCHNGFDSNGCDMGTYCATSWGECPPVCYNTCNFGETYCDMGFTDDWCWLGNYCAPEGEDCAAATWPAKR